MPWHARSFWITPDTMCTWFQSFLTDIDMNNDQSPDPGLDAQHSQHGTDNTPPPPNNIHHPFPPSISDN